MRSEFWGAAINERRIQTQAVAAYREALKELNIGLRAPLDWATTQTNLASALLALAGRESGTAKLEEAVGAYRQALLEHNPPAGAQSPRHDPIQTGGIALRVLGEGESGTAKLEEAVAAYREVLKELTRKRAPLDWATTQNNLAAHFRSSGSARQDCQARRGSHHLSRSAQGMDRERVHSNGPPFSTI